MKLLATTAASCKVPEQILKRSLKFALALSNNEVKATLLNYRKMGSHSGTN